MHPTDFWALLGLAMLGVRLVQGWIYWGGASRRLIYSVGKLDPSSHAYMAYKMNHAVPGAIFGTGQALSYVLHHPTLMYVSIIIFTLVELVVGVGLILGFMTRFLGLVSIGLALSLMLMFGWLGSTCVDEWTMASDSFAMGLGIMIAGGGSWWSLDHWIARQFPALAERRWFPWMFSGPLPIPSLMRLAKILGVLAIVFTVGFYGYLRGAVYSPLTARTNPKHHHIALSHPKLTPDGDLTVDAYVNAGPDTQGAYVIQAAILNGAGQVVETWDGKTLSDLPATDIVNDFAYSHFKPTKYGLIGILGARATITLPHHDSLTLQAGSYSLVLSSIDGKKWTIPVTITTP
jgi:thiosulfate dehydrogenase [quinone] large subunit